MILPFEEILSNQARIEEQNLTILQILKNRPKKHFTIQEVSQRLKQTDQTTIGQIKKGLIEATKVGRKYLIPEDELERICKEVKSLKYQRVG